MTAERTRGPSPDDPEEQLNDLVDRVTRMATDAAARATVNIQGYREAGDSSWQKWVLTICGGLALTGIIGGVVMYGTLSAYGQRLSNIEEQLKDLKRLVEPRYRGSP